MEQDIGNQNFTIEIFSLATHGIEVSYIKAVKGYLS